ncbi:MAG: DUF1643 domain-containing protein [Defluviitaleaceae bacterium]|nr:DUF1643 domain-containing protein [Defluviitaleaceae bacterium]
MNENQFTMRTRAIFHKDTHRLLLEKVWNEELPKATICMSNAGIMPSIYHMDYTTLFCINALSSLGYGSCCIVNLFSFMTPKLNLSGDLAELTCPENYEQIVTHASESDTFIWALGSIGQTYKKVLPFQAKLFDSLRPFAEKIFVIADASGREGLHPLSPSLRNKPWELVPFALPAPTADKTESEAKDGKPAPTNKPKKKE